MLRVVTLYTILKQNKYVDNVRNYLMQKLDITKNTVTAIYKELVRTNLIEEKWIEVGMPNIVYIKNWKSK